MLFMNISLLFCVRFSFFTVLSNQKLHAYFLILVTLTVMEPVLIGE